VTENLVSGSKTLAGFPAATFQNDDATHATVTVQNYSTPSDTNYLIFAQGEGTGSGVCSFSTTGKGVCSGGMSSVAAGASGRSLEMPAMFTTENWYEDFGTGQLQNGRATVILESDFAELVNTGVEYHVFLTPRGDCNGLYVGSQTAGSFEVRELRGGNANIAFDYRVVAKRRGMESVRLRDVTDEAKDLRTAPGERKALK
jgi:hypothetical protein